MVHVPGDILLGEGIEESVFGKGFWNKGVLVFHGAFLVKNESVARGI